MGDAVIDTYEVTYELREARRSTRVAIGDTSNHRTTFGDIPKIIAVVNGADATDVKVISALLVSTEPSSLVTAQAEGAKQ